MADDGLAVFVSSSSAAIVLTVYDKWTFAPHASPAKWLIFPLNLIVGK